VAIKIINQISCIYLAQDVLALPEEVLEKNFWEMYKDWQTNGDSPLTALWESHREDHDIRVLFALQDLLGLKLEEFQKLSVFELQSLLPEDGKFLFVEQKLAA
jgi:hypothetical protein